MRGDTRFVCGVGWFWDEVGEGWRGGMRSTGVPAAAEASGSQTTSQTESQSNMNWLTNCCQAENEKLFAGKEMSACRLVLWKISTTIRWIARKSYTDIYGTRRINPNDFSLSPDFSTRITMTFVIQSEILWQLLDGFPWNLLQIFKVPTGWILMTSVIVLLFLLVPPAGQSVLNIYLMDWHQILYIYSWFPEDVF